MSVKSERAERLAADRERRRVLRDIRQTLADIAAAHADPEHAHLLEDKLYTLTLRAIADGVSDAPALAAEALKTAEANQVRWYA